MATHFSILAWRVPCTEEPGGLWSIGSQSQTWLKWLSTHTGEERVRLCEKGGVIRGPWWEESPVASSRMLPSQRSLLWSIPNTQGLAGLVFSREMVLHHSHGSPSLPHRHELITSVSWRTPFPSRTPIHTQSLSPACVQCVSWRPNRTGQKRRGRKQTYNNGYGYPFSGTTSDAKWRFCRGPGQGPGTDTEPYLKTTVRCLYLFGSKDRGGRGAPRWGRSGLSHPKPRPQADRHELSSPWAAPGAGTKSAQSRSSESRLPLLERGQGEGGAGGKVIRVTSLNKGRRWKARGVSWKRGSRGGGGGGKEMIAGETDAIEQDSWRWISLPWSTLKSLRSD